MKAEYDLSKLKSRKNPYASQLKKQITIRLDEDSITYFKIVSEEVGIPYQSLINLYLRDCLAQNRRCFGADAVFLAVLIFLAAIAERGFLIPLPFGDEVAYLVVG